MEHLIHFPIFHKHPQIYKKQKEFPVYSARVKDYFWFGSHILNKLIYLHVCGYFDKLRSSFLQGLTRQIQYTINPDTPSISVLLYIFQYYKTEEFVCLVARAYLRNRITKPVRITKIFMCRIAIDRLY